MQSTKPSNSVTFKVDDVTPASNLLPTCKVLDAVKALLDAPPGKFAADETELGNPTRGKLEACWSYSLDCVADVKEHPLIAATHLAFSQHRPLSLSPDVIWVTIAQGLAQHIRLDPEKYRHLLVRHQGRQQLVVTRNDMHRGSPENPWDAVVADFSRQVQQHVGEFAEKFVCDFSTTGPVERTVSQIVLLDAVQPYFSFLLVCICGIPAITLEGTVADWQKLREKVELLEPFDADWWVTPLRTTCDQFVRAASGDVDLPHWQRIYKVAQTYGRELTNGWIAYLFPYLKQLNTGSFSRRNPLLYPDVTPEEAAKQERRWGPQWYLGSGEQSDGITVEDLPRGLSQVPFTLMDSGGRRAMELVGGPVVVTQDAEQKTLRPTLGWAVREAAPIEQALTRLAEHKLIPSSGTFSMELVFSLRVSYVPSDILRFYSKAEEAVILDGWGGPLCKILPFTDWKVPAWLRPAEDESEDGMQRAIPGPFHFAETMDGQEILLHLESEGEKTGTVTLGRHRDGTPSADSGTRIAKSFTDFLLQAVDKEADLYFRRAGFKPMS